MSRPSRRIALLTAAVALLAGCRSGEPPRVAPPSPGSPEATVLPTNLVPGAARSDLARGEARLEVTGDAEATLSLPLAPPGTYRPPDGGFVVNWADRDGNVLGIGGTLFTGDRATTSDLALTFVVAGSGVYSSSLGECEITMERVDASGFEGTFECDQVPGGAGRWADATGRFSAQTA